jgi:hypothetical protein
VEDAKPFVTYQEKLLQNLGNEESWLVELENKPGTWTDEELWRGAHNSFTRARNYSGNIFASLIQPAN